MNEFKWIFKHLPRFEFKDLFGIDHIITRIKSQITAPIKLPIEKINSYDQTIGNILSVGPDGTYKSELAEAITDEIKAMYFDINLNLMAESKDEKTIEKLFSDISRYEHAVIYCEIPEEGNTLNKIIKAQREYMKINGVDSVILIATSKEPWNINLELFAGDNFKYIINHTLPNKEIRKKLLFFGEFDETDYEKDFPFEMLADMTRNYSYDDFELMSVGIHISKDFIKRASKKNDVTYRAKQFIRYVKKHPANISDEEVLKYEDWRNNIIDNKEFSGEII